MITTGNSEVATAVGAGINIDMGPKWDWSLYVDLANPPAKELACPVCSRQKSKGQTVCSVCYTNILDSRNGFYPERLSKSGPVST